MNWDLSQICCRCRKLKQVKLGRRFRDGTRYNTWKFICASCDEKPTRMARFDKETPPERAVRRFLTGSGHEFTAEYQLGRFIYDFALLRLRLLIEIDSKRWHKTYSQKRRDHIKTNFAKEQGWELVRIKTGRHVELKTELAISARVAELGMS